MYYYWGFGLNILSEIPFPELLPFDFETPDVTICSGKTPDTLSGENVTQRLRVSFSPDEYLLKVLNVANYYVAHGNKILVEALTNDMKSVRLFLLGNTMAAILHQRNLIPLHASGIFCDGGVALFCSESGMGKSTLITALQLQGHKIFTDDVCVLKPRNNKQTEAIASYPMVKLWEDSFAKTGLEMADEENRIRPQLSKYARFYHDSFNTAPFAVKSIFVLDKSIHIREAELMKLSAIDAFSELQKNSYRPMQMNAMRKRSIHFAAISALTTTATVYKITRPEHINSIEQVTRLVASFLS